MDAESVAANIHLSPEQAGRQMDDDLPVSYDLAVWDGVRPTNDKDAGDVYDSLFDQYLEVDDLVAPTERIRAYVSALVQRYPDTGADSPWSSTPITGDCAGPIIYLTMVWSRCEEASAGAAQPAAQHGFVCYDPQSEGLRS